MQSQDGQIISLGPFGGLDGTRYADSLGQPSNPLPQRGGYNVQAVDGEWWSRAGYACETAGTRQRWGSVPWRWAIQDPSLPSSVILCSPDHIFQYRPGTDRLIPLYAEQVTESISFTNGSRTATSTSTLKVGDFVLLLPDSDEAYTITAVSGTTITLERPYEGANGAKSCRVYESLRTTLNGGTGVAVQYVADLYRGTGSTNHLASGVGIIEQLVEHSAGSLHGSSPDLVAGHRYLVMAHSLLSSPVAIDLDDSSGTPLFNWAYTLAYGGAAITNPKLLAVHKNRVMITGDDPNGEYGEKTIWFSWPNDLGFWHSGLSTGFSVGNYQTFDGHTNHITSLNSLGNSLVVYRERSIELGRPSASPSAPFSFSSLKTNVGCVSYGSVAEAAGRHFFWSREGPMEMTEQGPAPIGTSLRTLLSEDFDQGILPIVDEQAGRIAWHLTSDRHRLVSTPAYASLQTGDEQGTYSNNVTSLVYDYQRGSWWWEDRQNWCGSNIPGSEKEVYFPIQDGTVLKLDRDGAKDADDTGPNASAVDALVQTPWMRLGAPNRRTMIRRIVMGLRSFNSNPSGRDEFTNVWGAPGDTLHLGTLDIYCDHDATNVQASQDVSITGNEMLAYAYDENWQLPILEFVLNGLRKSAMTYKFVFRNALSAAATAAGHTKAPFRIAFINVSVTQGEGDRPEFWR